MIISVMEIDSEVNRRKCLITCSAFSALMLVVALWACGGPVSGQIGPAPAVGISPDDGFPIWLTPDVEDYLPLRASQTSGLDWVATDTSESGNVRHWLLAVDDANEGGIHLLSVESSDSGPVLGFHHPGLTLAPPDITGLPMSVEEGYDWEAIAYHPWSGTMFLSHEGHANEVAIYAATATPGDVYPSAGAYGRAGEVATLPGHLSDIVRLDLPGWNEVIRPGIGENLGIEGIACTEDRLFLGLESPYEFIDRLSGEKSTILVVYSINAGNPSNMEECELLAVHDTWEWAGTLGCTIETICDLDAMDSTHIVGVDRDHLRLFAVELSEEGEFVNGRVLFPDTPGPAPLESDCCPQLDGLPRLILPTAESVAIVPLGWGEADWQAGDVCVYTAVDPWAPGWALQGDEWRCDSYERRLSALLPALYRYSVSSGVLFPGI